MATTKTLRLTFKNAKDKKVNLSLAEAAEDLTAEEVKNAMNEMWSKHFCKGRSWSISGSFICSIRWTYNYFCVWW